MRKNFLKRTLAGVLSAVTLWQQHGGQCAYRIRC